MQPISTIKMEKVFIKSFVGNKKDISVVKLTIKFKDKYIALFTNLIQWFIYCDKDNEGKTYTIPLSDFGIIRNFRYDNKRVIEFDDAMYRVKYLMNNGEFDKELIEFMLRVEDAIRNGNSKQEFKDKILSLL